MTRFRDSGEFASDFLGDHALVVCPSCAGCARRTPSRAVCRSCAWYVDERVTLPLWLSTSVGDEELWAYNAEHLDLLEAYVSADLRERVLERRHDMTTMVERLPPWLKAAKNREAVLAGIARLRKRLPDILV